jgi:uncharacterized membrane protein YeaQ/YmgE (transglycosylase-associated protein family)
MHLLWFILIGLAAGWLAGKIMKGKGVGAVGNIIVGVIGALIGGFLFRLPGISSDGGLTGSLVVATIGAVVLLYLLRLLKKTGSTPPTFWRFRTDQVIYRRDGRLASRFRASVSSGRSLSASLHSSRNLLYSAAALSTLPTCSHNVARR